jgi:hypothetical protein
MCRYFLFYFSYPSILESSYQPASYVKNTERMVLRFLLPTHVLGVTQPLWREPNWNWLPVIERPVK